MRQCPSCRSYSAYSVCTTCGADLPAGGGEGAVYGRGFIEIAKTRAGLRIIVTLIGLAIVGLLSLISSR